MKKYTLALLLTACIERPVAQDADSEPSPPTSTLTYGDAYQGWARGYCAYAQRCYPAWVWAQHRTQEGCVSDVQVEQCDPSWKKCASPFPVQPRNEPSEPGQPDPTLDAILHCTTDVTQLACDATRVPASCAILR